MKTAELVHYLKRKARENADTIVDLSVILVIGLVSVTWFRGDFIVKGGDSYFSLSPSFNAMISSRYVWVPVSTGAPMPMNIVGLPYYMVMMILQSAGLSLVSLEKIEFYFLFSVSGLAMYYLSLTFGGGKCRRVVCLTSSIFYMMNPFTLTVIWRRLTTLVFAYSLLPLVLTLFVKGLEAKQHSSRYILLILLCWLVFPLSMSNPGYVVAVWVALFTYLLFFVITNHVHRTRCIHALRFTLTLVALWSFSNLWWLLPLFPHVTQTYEFSRVSGEHLDVFLWTSKSAILLNSMRLLGDWTLYGGYLSDPYFPWVKMYFSLPFVAMSLLIPFLACASLLRRFSQRNLVYCAVLSIVGLFLMKGAAPPLGELNVWVLSNLPMGGVFRSSYEKFGIIVALSYAFLIGNGVDELVLCLNRTLQSLPRNKKCYSRMGVRLRKLAPSLLLISLQLTLGFVLVFPFWSGDVIYPGGEIIPSMRIQVPEYYYEAEAWMNAQKDEFKLFYLPPLYYTRTAAYTWDYGYFGSDPLDEYFLQRPLVGGPTGIVYADQFQKEVIDLFFELEPSSNIGKLLGLMNIKYVLVHRDFNTKYVYYIPEPAYFEKVLRRQNNIHLEQTFGKLAFYRIRDYLPLVYASSDIIFVQGNVSVLPLLTTLTSFIELDDRPAFFFSDGTEQNTSLVASMSKSVMVHAVNRGADGYDLTVPISGSYDIYAQVNLKIRKGALRYRIDNENWRLATVSSNQTEATIVKVGTVNATAGKHTIIFDDTYLFSSKVKGFFLYHSKTNEEPHSIVPEVKFKKIDSTKYLVDVNATEPFFLILSESFHPNWTAKLDNVLLPHLLANGYSNAWFLNGSGSFRILMEFWPQKLFDLGVVISTLSLAVLVVFVVYAERFHKSHPIKEIFSLEVQK